MLATSKSRSSVLPARAFLSLLLLLCLVQSSAAQDNAAFAARAEKVFLAAKVRLGKDPANAEAQWKFAKACFDWADYSTTDSKREEIARQGIAAAQSLIDSDSNSAPGHYFLAMNLGQMAESKTVGALKIIPQMETNFQIALGLDAAFDYAGPDRNLGLLYLQAPGWGLSIGSNAKAKLHLQKAARLSPDYPGNLLYLIEAEIGWGEKTTALKDLKILDEIWPRAREKFPAAEFAADWADWEKRRAEAGKKLEKTAKPVGSPRGGTDR